MEEYKGILFDITCSFPSKIFTHFFKGTYRENCWNDIISIKEKYITFGFDQDYFKIEHVGLNSFSIITPSKFIDIKDEIEIYFESFLKEKNMDVFLFSTHQNKTMIPLGNHSSIIHEWILKMENELNKKLDNWNNELLLRTNGWLNYYFSFEPKKGFVSLHVYAKNFRDREKQLVRRIHNEEELDAFIQELKTLSKANEIIQTSIKEVLHSLDLSDERTYKGYKVYHEYYDENFKAKYEEHILCYAFDIGNKKFSFTSLEELEDAFPKKELMKKFKAIRLKSLFEKKEVLH